MNESDMYGGRASQPDRSISSLLLLRSVGSGTGTVAAQGEEDMDMQRQPAAPDEGIRGFPWPATAGGESAGVPQTDQTKADSTAVLFASAV